MSGQIELNLQLPVTEGDDRSFRILYLHNVNKFSERENCKSEESAGGGVPLFLGTDVLSGCPKLRKNHGRIHARFAKEGLASKVTLNHNVRINGIPYSNGLWFYNIRGVFQAVFEYCDIQTQKFCLLHLRDLWLSRINDKTLPPEMDLEYLHHGGEELVPLSPVTDVITREKSETTLKESSLNVIQGRAEIVYTKPKGVKEFHDLLIQLKNVLDENVEFYNADLKNYLNQLNYILNYFEIEIKDENKCYFPLELINDYNLLIENEEDYVNDFEIPLQKHIVLCLISKWLGCEFSELYAKINDKTVKFKTEHITNINEMPPSIELVQHLFPKCMEILLLEWMKKHNEVLQENEPTKKKLKTDKLNKLYPFLQLILEFANDSLVSGVSHVLYSRLIQSV